MQTILEDYCTSKVTKIKKKIVVYNILHHKTILGSDIYSKLLFLHMFTGWDATFSTYGVGKAIAFQS